MNIISPSGDPIQPRLRAPSAEDHEFFDTLASCGKINLAAAKVGWALSFVEQRRRPALPDGAPNPDYQPEFAARIERALAAFQIGHIANIAKAAKDKVPGDWKADVWILERLFGPEYAQTKSGDAAPPGHSDGPLLVALTKEELEVLRECREKALQTINQC